MHYSTQQGHETFLWLYPVSLYFYPLSDSFHIEIIHVFLPGFIQYQILYTLIKNKYLSMDFLVILLIAIGLSFDTFAASICIGLTVQQIRFLQALKIAIILSVFQAVMPVIGWFLGSQVKDQISQIDHWLAFGLLSLIGLKMIREGLQSKSEYNHFDPSRLIIIIGIAVATSIDALIAGVSFAFIEINILLSAATIGIITGIAAMLGMLFGKKTGKKLGKRMELLGGIILIGIGVKILLEHLN